MSGACSGKQQAGFSLIELLAALGIFLVVTGAAFTLLSSSQQRYQTDSQLLTSFQEARLGLDQIVRDINDAGYPPPSFIGTDSTLYTKAPFGWSTGYPSSPCAVGVSCITPSDFDLIIETNPDQQTYAKVQWIRYKLVGQTLMRGMTDKVSGDPATATDGALAPFVQNVVNNSPSLQIGLYQLSVSNPNVFQGGNPVAIFQYTCDTPTTFKYPAPDCSAAGADNSPANIRDIAVTLVVAAPLPDATTGMPRLVQLTARGRRLNPNQ